MPHQKEYTNEKIEIIKMNQMDILGFKRKIAKKKILRGFIVYLN